MKRLFWLLNWIILLNLNEAKFVNYVEYPEIRKVYKFDLVVSHGLSMAIRNDKRSTWDPCVFDVVNQQFIANIDKNNNFNCEFDTVVLNKTEEDSIITAAGLNRQMLLINDQFPGPSIVVPLNSRVEITVHNRLMTSTLSMHWHGLTQKYTFTHDGVAHVTQCPISPMESYTYVFNADNEGTHWYHSHSGIQRTDGLYGAFIVFKPNDTSSEHKQESNSKSFYDKEYYLFVQDWNQRLSEELFSFPLWKNFKYTRGFNNKSCENRMRIDDGSILPTVPPDTVVINGKNWINLPENSKDLNKLGTDLLKYPIESFYVKPNKKYLFRVVGANAAFALQISFEGHKLRVISTDGNPMQPIENVDILMVHGGERYDIELETKNETFANNYLILVKVLAITDEKFDDLKREYYAVGLLKYENADPNKITFDQRECKTETPCIVVNCPFKKGRNNRFICINAEEFKSPLQMMSPFERENLFKTHYDPDEFEEYSLNLHFAGFVEARSSINGKQFQEPKQPPFFPLDYKDAIHVCPKDCVGSQTCHCTQVLNITPGKVIQFTFYHMGIIDGFKCTNHPLHLHGHHFYVVSQQYPDYYENATFKKNNAHINCSYDTNDFCNEVGWSDKDFYNGNIPNANLVNPIKKDTIIVPCGGYTTIRFISDNPGYWLMHCHIENHHANGMALLIKEGTHEEIKSLVNVDEINTCFKGYKEITNTTNKNENFYQKQISIWKGLFFGILAAAILSNVILLGFSYSYIKRKQKTAINIVTNSIEKENKKF